VPRRLDDEHPYVLFVGIDWERKGGPLLLDAFRRVRAARPSARLVIVGCTPEVTDEGVEVVGYLDKDDAADRTRLLDLYAGATCFALLSDLDPFPNVILEAAYLGVPAVSTNEGSRPELIVDGETGLLVDRDVDEIAAAIVDLLADAGRADAMGRAAQRRVEERFTWPAVSHHILSEMGLSPAAAN
jgi:glycosyltransferase involved in cell wall biosynthesis